MPRNRVKCKRKSKHRKEDRSKIVPIKDAQSAEEGIKTLESPRCVSKKEKSAKQVHIAYLPEKYQPLVEEDIYQPRDDHIKKKQDKYKKLRQNVGKALRYTWKCLVVGLQNLSTAYSMPLGAATTIVPDIHRARSHVTSNT